MYPAVNLNQLYSLHLYDGLEIIFEDLKMLDYEALKETNKQIIIIVPTVVMLSSPEYVPPATAANVALYA